MFASMIDDESLVYPILINKVNTNKIKLCPSIFAVAFVLPVQNIAGKVGAAGTGGGSKVPIIMPKPVVPQPKAGFGFGGLFKGPGHAPRG